VGSAIAASAIIRLFLTFLRWSEGFSKPGPRPSYLGLVWGFNVGVSENDYFQPFIVGLLELLVYPVLLAAGHPQYVGAWLGLKVVPKLGAWSTNRATYQRFLIGNALVIVFSYFLQLWFYA
jgi:hypothetical protein